MIDAAFAIPGDINLPTGGYVYDRRVMALLPGLGVRARHVALSGSFPAPSVADLAEAQRLLASVDAGTVVIVDGLALGAMPAALIESLRSPLVALVHHPLCLEAGLSPARRDELFALEKAALGLARRVIVTSNTTARTLVADFSIAMAKIAVAVPGTDPAQRAHGTRAPLQLLAVGSVVPRKAYDTLVRALAPLRDRGWRLAIVGPTDRDPQALAAVQTALADMGLARQIDLVGAVGTDNIAKFYAAADVFVMPSLYEGYGMALAEAMAHGLPIICTTGGAAAETVSDAAALKVPPGDQPALTAALGRLLEDASLRRRMADAAWIAGQKLPPWEDTARIVAGVIRDVEP